MGLVGRTRLKAGCQLGLGAASAGPAACRLVGENASMPSAVQASSCSDKRSGGGQSGHSTALLARAVPFSVSRAPRLCRARSEPEARKEQASSTRKTGRERNRDVSHSSCELGQTTCACPDLFRWSCTPARGEWRPSLSSGPRRGVVALSVGLLGVDGW